jgi:hypothetical protein
MTHRPKPREENAPYPEHSPFAPSVLSASSESRLHTPPFDTQYWCYPVVFECRLGVCSGRRGDGRVGRVRPSMGRLSGVRLDVICCQYAHSIACSQEGSREGWGHGDNRQGTSSKEGREVGKAEKRTSTTSPTRHQIRSPSLRMEVLG